MKKLPMTILMLAGLIWLNGCLGSLSTKNNERMDALQAAKHLALACHLYAQDNDDSIPPTTIHLIPYADNTYDPEDFVMVATGKLTQIDNPNETALLQQKIPLADGSRAVAFVDGHVEIVMAP